MKSSSHVQLLTVMLLGSAGLASAQAPNPELDREYLGCYLGINDAEKAEKDDDFLGAYRAFLETDRQLIRIHHSDPEWETALVLHRIDDCQAKIAELAQKVAALAPHQPQLLAAPSAVDKTFGDALPSTTPPEFTQWRNHVSADLFWIGEQDNTASAWDPHWKVDYSGKDVPSERNGYAPAGHAAGLNPFYVALPFNDLAHPQLASKWMPEFWKQKLTSPAANSLCQGKWVEIKNENGTACYAQWEDVGPKGDADADYVFGNLRSASPSSGHLSLSPAVAQYLHWTDGSGLVSWRFVDARNVHPGAWLKLDEQAVIFRASSQAPPK